jgi:hypothetical protein
MSEQQAVMRTSLLPNLIAAIARNQSFGRPDVALFEVGSVFLRRGEGLTERPIHELADEPTWAAAVLAGRRPAAIGDGAPCVRCEGPRDDRDPRGRWRRARHMTRSRRSAIRSGGAASSLVIRRRRLVR